MNFNLSPKKSEPIDFLQYLTDKPTFTPTITEKIFEEEKKTFVERMKNQFNSKQMSPLNKLCKKYSISPKLEKKLRVKLLKTEEKPKDYSLNRLILPKIEKSSTRFNSPQDSENKFVRRKFSIGKIIKTYEEGVEKSATTNNLKSLVVRNSVIAKEYAKEMMKASEILNEVEEFHSDLKKKLYLEIKSSKDGYESEKYQIIKEFTTKVVLAKRYKTKKLKNLIRNKANPKIL